MVSYYSRSTTKEEKKWDTRELEVLAIIVTLEHFTHLIEGLPIIQPKKRTRAPRIAESPGGVI